jgi:hypothetical protein
VVGVGVNIIREPELVSLLHLVVHTGDVIGEERVDPFDGHEYSVTVALEDDTRENYALWVQASGEPPNDEEVLPDYVLLSAEKGGAGLESKDLEQGLEDLRDRLRKARA